MRKHPLVRNMRRLNFHLVPVTGVAKCNGGGKKFRAEFVRGYEEGDNRGVLGVDEVIAEAIEAHRLQGVSPAMLKLYVESVLQTMIDKTVEDGRTRRFDDYLSVSLKIHGGFEEKSDDYDFDRHSLALTVQALNAFRPDLNSIYPVNVNRAKQFRLSYITAADGQHKNHEVVFGREFIIRGSNLTLPTNGLSGVFCQVNLGDAWSCAEAPILEKSDSEIRCAWPEDYGPEVLRHTLWASVTKVANIEANPPDVDRTAHAGILPE